MCRNWGAGTGSYNRKSGSTPRGQTSIPKKIDRHRQREISPSPRWKKRKKRSPRRGRRKSHYLAWEAKNSLKHNPLRTRHPTKGIINRDPEVSGKPACLVRNVGNGRGRGRGKKKVGGRGNSKTFGELLKKQVRPDGERKACRGSGPFYGWRRGQLAAWSTIRLAGGRHHER